MTNEYSSDNTTEVLTVVIPTYNEEKLIGQTVREIQRNVLNHISPAGLIVVDGGSTDNTVKILDSLAQTDKRIQVIQDPGCKHGPSLILGMNKARGEYLFLLDSDMQIPLSRFAELWDMKHHYDAILGTRRNRQDSKLRLAISFIAALLIQIIFAVNLCDANAPCKLFRRSIWQALQNDLGPGTESLLVPSIFLAIYAKTHNYKVVEIPVAHNARAAGENIGLNKIILSCFLVLKDIFKYRNRLLSNKNN